VKQKKKVIPSKNKLAEEGTETWNIYLTHLMWDGDSDDAIAEAAAGDAVESKGGG